MLKELLGVSLLADLVLHFVNFVIEGPEGDEFSTGEPSMAEGQANFNFIERVTNLLQAARDLMKQSTRP